MPNEVNQSDLSVGLAVAKSKLKMDELFRVQLKWLRLEPWLHSQ